MKTRIWLRHRLPEFYLFGGISVGVNLLFGLTPKPQDFVDVMSLILVIVPTIGAAIYYGALLFYRVIAKQ